MAWLASPQLAFQHRLDIGEARVLEGGNAMLAGIVKQTLLREDGIGFVRNAKIRPAVADQDGVTRSAPKPCPRALACAGARCAVRLLKGMAEAITARADPDHMIGVNWQIGQARIS